MRIADSGAKNLNGERGRRISAAIPEPAGMLRPSGSFFTRWPGRAAARVAFTVALFLFAGNAGLAQSPGQAKAAADSKEDIKQAQQLADRGDKSFAAGRSDEA